MADMERLEFTDEEGRHWSGWRSDEGRIDLSDATERPADDSGVRAYTELLEGGGFAISPRTQNPERRLSPEQEAAYARAEEIMRTHRES